MKVVDLGSFLGSWPYDPENNVRVARGADGREIILVRQSMGLEHYEIDGPPDGRRIQGMESVFDFHRARLDAAKQSNVLIGFDLSANDCAELFDESVLYHHRLHVLFRLKDWTRVERDAAHNLRLIEFIKQYARCEEDRVQLDHWRPDIARIDAVARAMILLEKGQYRDALRIACDIISNFGAAADDWPDHGTLAEALVESVRESLANRPTLRTDEESLFLQHNDYWTIRYQGHAAFLKDSRGLHCLALLLRYPGREFHASELLASLILMGAPWPPPAVTANRRLRDAGDQLISGGLSDAGPVLDAQAKAECKRRLKDLRQELKEAEQFNDPERAAKAQHEVNRITQQLASAIGLGGRDRKTCSEAERARSAVTKRIKRAIRKIGEAIPSLGHHLSARIKAGYFCSYNPHPDRPVVWKFRICWLLAVPTFSHLFAFGTQNVPM
jgi:DNA-binding XRE family transcriptional regulator